MLLFHITNENNELNIVKYGLRVNENNPLGLTNLPIRKDLIKKYGHVPIYLTSDLNVVKEMLGPSTNKKWIVITVSCDELDLDRDPASPDKCFMCHTDIKSTNIMQVDRVPLTHLNNT